MAAGEWIDLDPTIHVGAPAFYRRSGLSIHCHEKQHIARKAFGAVRSHEANIVFVGIFDGSIIVFLKRSMLMPLVTEVLYHRTQCTIGYLRSENRRCADGLGVLNCIAVKE